jgi:alkylation response protein AidB-like acyl-CoA dehydrogenase
MNRESAGTDYSILKLARSLGQADDPMTRQAVADYHATAHAHHIMSDRVTRAIGKGIMNPSSGSLLKLAHAITSEKHAQATVDIGGSAVVVGGDNRGEARDLGNRTLTRQGIALGGGSNEIQRNIISERVLGMPREWAGDVDVPYRDVRRSGGGATGPKN